MFRGKKNRDQAEAEVEVQQAHIRRQSKSSMTRGNSKIEQRAIRSFRVEWLDDLLRDGVNRVCLDRQKRRVQSKLIGNHTLIQISIRDCYGSTAWWISGAQANIERSGSCFGANSENNRYMLKMAQRLPNQGSTHAQTFSKLQQVYIVYHWWISVELQPATEKTFE